MYQVRNGKEGKPLNFRLCDTHGIEKCMADFLSVGLSINVTLCVIVSRRSIVVTCDVRGKPDDCCGCCYTLKD